jgi:diguanylate cyclase (GGDEF)-like protein
VAKLVDAASAVHRDTVVDFPLVAGDTRPDEVNVILIAHPEGKLLGTRFRLSPGHTLEIGRAASADIAFPNVPSLSRSHARLNYSGRTVRIEDLGSTNGTFVNDRRIRTPRHLKSGDRFQTGTIHFKFLQGRDVEQSYHDAIEDLAMRDGLTEIFNKRKFDKDVEREFARAKRYDRNLSLVAFDVDHFKAVNDTYGHSAGDAVLKQLAARVSSMIRAEQVFSRVGGEEFAILCPEALAADAALLAEKLRSAIASEKFRHGSFGISITCSFGIAGLVPETADPQALAEDADRALYLSKKRGRDRVTVHSSHTTSGR